MWGIRRAAAKLRPYNARNVIRLILIALIVGAFLALDYKLFRKLFEAASKIEELTPFFAIGLLENFLGLVFLVATMTLLFSAMTTAIGSFFTDQDLELQHAAPISRTRLALNAWIGTLVRSAWLVFFFLLPVFAALGIQYDQGFDFMFSALIDFALLLSIPVSIASIAIVSLVRFFPVRHVHQIAATLAIIILSAAVIGFRVARPERLFGDVQTDELTAVLETIRLPIADRLPGHWLASSTASQLLGDVRLLPDPRLAVTAIALFLLFLLITRKIYYTAWVRSRESPAPVMIGASGVSSLLDRLLRSVRSQVRAIISKEARVISRDATQWSQLFLMVALLFIYLYNIQMMPLEGDARAAILAYLNLGMGGFVISAICLRFAYPSVSAEGRSFWLLRTAPVSTSTILWTKTVTYAAPLLLMSLALTALANWLLDAGLLIWLYTVPASLVMTSTLVALGVGMGGMNPDLKSENPVEVALSPGGFAYMAISLIYVGAMMFLFARPVQRFLVRMMFGVDTSGSAMWIGTPLIIAVVLSLLLAIVPIGLAARRIAAPD